MPMLTPRPSSTPATLTPTVCETCRICGSRLRLILTLGDLHLSDFPHQATTRAHEPVPLDLYRCTNPACTLVQLGHTTPRDWLYTQYWYQSGINETMVRELKDVVESALARVTLRSPRPIVVDIGANDGTLLAQYRTYPQTARATTVGYEPAKNLYQALRPHATVVFPTFFAVAQPWSVHAQAEIVTSIAMFYDLPDPLRFTEDVRKILAPHGVWVIQQAYLPAMLQATGLDNICHEHLEYYSLTSLKGLLNRVGLTIFDVQLRSINGGSFRTFVGHTDAGWTVQPSVSRMLADEAELFDDPDLVYRSFRQKVEATRGYVQAALSMFTEQGQPVDLYGASTKANTLLQYCGVDRRTIRQAWERSPEKVGRYVGTSGIPIVEEAAGRANPPAALFVGIWAFRDAVMARESDYLAQGGRLIVPLPTLEIVQQAGAQPPLQEAQEEVRHVDAV